MGVKRDRESAGMSEGASAEMSGTISEDEAKLYDRQIRLWGLESQRRIRAAKVLVIGLNGLGVEVVKNLTLSGVMSITLIDNTPVSESDSSAQFFAVGAEAGQSRAAASLKSIRELNPRVVVVVDPTPIPSIPRDYFALYNVVFVCDQLLTQLIRISKACHEQHVQFFCGDTWGMYGYGFLDLLSHTLSTVEVDKGKEKKTEQTFKYTALGPSLGYKFPSGPKRINKVYPIMHIMNNFREQEGRFPSPASRDEDFEKLKTVRNNTVVNLRMDVAKVPDDLLSCVFGELSPVCAAVGGIMANEIVKGLTRQKLPIFNFLLFDGDICQGVEAKIVVPD